MKRIGYTCIFSAAERLRLRRFCPALTLWITASLLIVLGGCAAGADPPDSENGNHNGPAPPDTGADWWRPGVQTTWQWQLQPNDDDQINLTYNVDAYDLDLFDAPASLIEELHDDGCPGRQIPL